MDDRAARLAAVAKDYKLPIEIVARKLEEAAVEAARGTTARAKVQPRRKKAAATIRTPGPIAPAAATDAPQGEAMMPDKTLGRLRDRYKKRLATIELPPDGFTKPEQAKAAKNLADDFKNLCKRLIERKLEPIEKDWRVTEAHRLRSKFERAEKKAAGRGSNRGSKIEVKNFSPRLG